MKYMKNILVLILLVIAISSCKKSKGFSEEMLVKPVDLGQYYTLEKDQIKLFLPEGYKELSESEIKDFHRSIKNKDERYYFEKAYEQRKVANGNHYDFYNEELFSEVYVNTLPYMPFNKSNASQLLYYLRKNHERYQNATGIYHNKIKATYIGQQGLQVFKARYRLTKYNSYSENSNEEDYEMFSTIYLISSNQKTFLLNIMTPFEMDFDPFIRKIQL